MGGKGSGGYRWNKKETAESRRRIDIRYMHKRGMLMPGCTGSLKWTSGGQEAGGIGFTVVDGRLLLAYGYREHGGEWQEVTEAVHLARTSCHFGGWRPWFVCPGCDRRVAVLHGAGRLFLCRHCCDLTYESRRENRAGRMRNKAQEIRQRLGGSGSLSEPFPKKPPRMHWRTYERLLCRAEDAERGSWLALSEWLQHEDKLFEDHSRRRGIKKPAAQ